ncbi:MAG: AMP-binding protein [Chlamydiota bacterium]
MKNFLCPIAYHAHLSPKNIALDNGSKTLSYAQAEMHIQNLQLYLQKFFVCSKIGILAHISMETILLYFAAMREGFSVCLMNPKDPTQLLEEKIKELDLSVLFINGEAFNQNSSVNHEKSTTYLYTSGSSAKPKIACISYSNLIYNALGLLNTLKLTSNSRYLLSLPLHHVSGLSILFRTFLSGATVVIPEPSYDLSNLLKETSLTHLSLVSTQYLYLLKTPNSSQKTLKSILLGGSSFSNSSLQEGIDKQLPIYLSYGLTEMSSTVCCNPLLKTKEPSHTGYLLPYRKLKITEEGEILVGGETLFQGYYDVNTKSILKQNLWFPTKDLGEIDKGTLKVYGRKDRLIISGGENIQPEEIELALLNIPEVKTALVLPIPDEIFGQKVIAIIDSDNYLSHETLHDHLQKSLPRYKLPKKYLPWPKHLKPEGLKISSSLKKELILYAITSMDLFHKQARLLPSAPISQK